MTLDKAKACDILGVSRGASEADIRAAYKRLALKWHPDKHANNDKAKEKFQEISAAYSYLTGEDKREYVLTWDEMVELFARMFCSSRASHNGYYDCSDDGYDDSDEDIWEAENSRRTFPRKTTEYSYTANRPTASEASKNAEELMMEEERQKKSREKRKSKKKRQREKKREEKVKKEEEEAIKRAELRKKEEFLQKAKETAEQAKQDAQNRQNISISTNSQHSSESTTKSTSTIKENHAGISDSFNSSKSKAKAPNESKLKSSEAKVKTATTGNRSRLSSDSVTDEDIVGWDQDSAFFAGAAAKKVATAASAAKPERPKKKGGAKSPKEEAESIDNMDPIVLQSRQTAVKGNEMANLGHYSAAIDLFTQAIELDPRDFRFFGNRSFCYDRLEQYESALKDASRAITLSKDWPKGYFRKGRALAGLKHFAEAESAFEHVLKLDKNCEDALEELNRVRIWRLMEMGFSRPQSDAAIRQYGSVQAALDALLTNGVEGVVNSFPEDVYISDEEDYITETIERSKLDSCNPLNLKSLWVGNLHSTISEKQLRDLFGPFGEIDSLRRLPDRFCAFINYKRPDEAAKALEKLQGVEFGGRFLLIKFPDNPIVDGQPRTTVLKKTVPGKQQPQQQTKAAQQVSNQTQLDASGNKVTGPVNGNECYFWRTTGCVFGDRCKYKHLKETKGADLKPWQKVVYDN